MYQKRKLSSAIFAITAAMSAAQYTYAQEAKTPTAGDIEEVQVSGIRASLKRSQDIKRDGAGVVDAISSEDIGKFPDQNLAESLQRITGVSIDRAGGEGQLITVRGFGPDFNEELLAGQLAVSRVHLRVRGIPARRRLEHRQRRSRGAAADWGEILLLLLDAGAGVE